MTKAATTIVIFVTVFVCVAMEELNGCSFCVAIFTHKLRSHQHKHHRHTHQHIKTMHITIDPLPIYAITQQYSTLCGRCAIMPHWNETHLLFENFYRTAHRQSHLLCCPIAGARPPLHYFFFTMPTMLRCDDAVSLASLPSYEYVVCRSI